MNMMPPWGGPDAFSTTQKLGASDFSQKLNGESFLSFSLSFFSQDQA